MAQDWSKIGGGSKQPLLRPRDIYAALPHRPWPYLRQEQGEVLEKWFTRRDDHDVVIKQNTGGGKTVAGLLIAQSTLKEGIGKVVYLAPDTYLATRVRQEAQRLGLPTAEDPNDPEFRGQQAILVTTFQKLVNGKSVFGVAGDGREPIDLGMVVIDDAHAALATAEGQFRLVVARHPRPSRRPSPASSVPRSAPTRPATSHRPSRPTPPDPQGQRSWATHLAEDLLSIVYRAIERARTATPATTAAAES